MARKLQEARGPGSKDARERKGQGAKVPWSKLARVLLADSLRKGSICLLVITNRILNWVDSYVLGIINCFVRLPVVVGIETRVLKNPGPRGNPAILPL